MAICHTSHTREEKLCGVGGNSNGSVCPKVVWERVLKAIPPDEELLGNPLAVCGGCGADGVDR